MSALGVDAAMPEIGETPARPWWRRRDGQLFLVGAALYLVTRLVGLGRFPIYFFTDEAVQATLADGLLHNDFRLEGVFLRSCSSGPSRRPARCRRSNS